MKQKLKIKMIGVFTGFSNAKDCCSILLNIFTSQIFSSTKVKNNHGRDVFTRIFLCTNIFSL